MIDTFAADAPKLMSRIQRAITKKDADRPREAAHALKGSVGNFSQGTPFAVARKLELLARQNQLSDAPGMFRQVRREIAQLTRSLQSLKGRSARNSAR